MASEQLILTAGTAQALNKKIQEHIDLGFEPIGEHKVVVIRNQLRYAGKQHMSTESHLEYSQTMRRNIDV